MAANGQLCRHCRRRKITEGAVHGLCFACFGEPSIRVGYMDVPFEKLMGDKRRLARRPTSFLPGTQGKIRVMRRRVKRGEQPCHPDDAREWRVGG